MSLEPKTALVEALAAKALLIKALEKIAREGENGLDMWGCRFAASEALAALSQPQPPRSDLRGEVDARIVEFFDKIGIGAGKDPIGFLLASHATMAHQRNTAEAQRAEANKAWLSSSEAYGAEIRRLEDQLAEAKGEVERLKASYEDAIHKWNADVFEFGERYKRAEAQRDRLLEAGKSFVNWPSAEYQFPPSGADFRALRTEHDAIREGTGDA